MRHRNFESKPPKGADLHHDTKLDLEELRRCDALRNGLGPIPGHCKWCNEVIGAAKREQKLNRNGTQA